MTNTKKTLPELFSNMLENYSLTKKIMPKGQKSDHWDIFPENYEDSIKQIDVWG
jgi:hypothetical protein